MFFQVNGLEIFTSLNSPEDMNKFYLDNYWDIFLIATFFRVINGDTFNTLTFLDLLTRIFLDD